MSKEASVGDKLAALNGFRNNLDSSGAVNLLRQSLEDRSNRVVGRAAELIAEAQDKSFVEDLLKVYRRLTLNPLKTDPGCIGKTEIVGTLVSLEHREADFYRVGIEYLQMEPVWGGQKDAAAELRARCAVGLSYCASCLEVLNRCAVLLGDPCFEARAGAARAIRVLAHPEGGPLLRLKLLVGDEVPEVLGECCSALLQSDREDGLTFVVQMLSSDQAGVGVQAALALGESRLANAFAPLRVAWERQLERSTRESFLVCIGLLRSTESREFLLSLIESKDFDTAADAIKALKVHGDIGGLKQRTKAAIAATGDAHLERIFGKEWGD